jgi:MFS family permease
MINQFPSFNLSESFRAFRHPNFRLFFWGQLFSLVGNWMQFTAQQWLVYRLTGSQTSLGLVTFINFLPVLLFSLYMGVIVDQFPRRRLILFTQSWFMILALLLAVLTWLGIIQYWHILVLSFLIGIGNALDMPARQAFVVEMVDDDKNDVMNAIGLNSSIFNVARIIGPAIGGAIVASLGEAPAFLINGISYLAVIFALLMMKVSLPVLSSIEEKPLERMRHGFSYILGDQSILGLVTMVAVFSFVGFGVLTLVPVFAKDILQIGVTGYGQLLTWQGWGALLAALFIVMFGDYFQKGKMLLISRLLLGPGILGLAFSRIPWVSTAFMALIGYSLITQLVYTNTLIQMIVPDDLRGRIMSTYTWALGGFYPLGSLLMGYLGDQIGAASAAQISGISSIVLIFASLFVFPSLQKLT